MLMSKVTGSARTPYVSAFLNPILLHFLYLDSQRNGMVNQSFSSRIGLSNIIVLAIYHILQVLNRDILLLTIVIPCLYIIVIKKSICYAVPD